MQLTHQDQIIIKQSQGWASRSISKIKSIWDRKYGKTLRDILDKSALITDNFRETWDNFVSMEEAERMVSDYNALATFSSIKITFDSIRMVIIGVVVPMLAMEKIDIPGYYKAQEEARHKKEEEARRGQKPKGALPGKGETSEDETSISSISDEEKGRLLGELEAIITDIRAGAVPDELTMDRNQVLAKIEQIFEALKNEQFTREEFFAQHKQAINLYKQYKKDLQAALAKKPVVKASRVCSELIKHAETVQNITSVYLLALGKYGPIRTPLKETWFEVKQRIPFIGETGEVYYYRKNAIQAVKELITFSKEFTKTIQAAISAGNVAEHKLSKWIAIIDKYNDFADLYNSKINFFVFLYDALRLKAKQVKLLKSKKDLKGKKKDLEQHDMGDFGQYDWQDLPTFTRNKFRPVEKIRF